jgi:hypothetical protein
MYICNMRKLIITISLLLVFNISLGQKINQTEFSVWLTCLKKDVKIKSNLKSFTKKLIQLESDIS